MPPLETVTFIVGAALIVIGILGGGIEVKEIKVPRIAGAARLAAVVVGGLFILLGTVQKVPQPPSKPEGSLAVRPADSPKNEFGGERKVEAKQEPSNQARLVSEQRAEEAERLRVAELQGRIIQVLSGTFRLDWRFGDGLYRSTLFMDGGSGRMRTFYYENGVVRGSVDQDMKLEFSKNSIYLVGSNPVVPGTNTPHPSYSPDNLLLRPVDGSLKLLMCDHALNCTSTVAMHKTDSSR